MIEKVPTPVVVLAALLAFVGTASASDVRRDVETLASAEMEGRLTGSEGARRAADYIIAELKKVGAQPLPGKDGYRLAFEFTAGVDDAGSSLRVGDWQAPADSVRGLSFSENGQASGDVVFAGYGITVPESQGFGYDSYHGLDVTDKVVLVLRYFPEDASAETRSILARYAGLRYKALNARERGAKALIVVAGPRSPRAGELVRLSFDSAAASSGIIAASITGEIAGRLFAGSGRTLAEAQEALDSANPHVGGFALEGARVELDVALERETRTGYNVAGMLPATAGGSDGAMVLLGAHYDHLGHGDQGNSLAGADEAGEIHHGADDNASGVAAVLEAARILSRRSRPAPVAFALWSGEELGLLGSAAFVAEPALPRERLRAYLNFDMVGRSVDDKLVLQATGTSSVWPRLIEQTNIPLGFDIQANEDPWLPTDVTSFLAMRLPSLNFFTGSHAEYHRPADTAKLVNYDALERIARFGALVAEKLARLDELPEYVEVPRTQRPGGNRDAVRAFTGTIPDYGTEVDGLLLSGVVAGGPAEEAGLQAGDVIVELAGQRIANIYDYTYALDIVKIDEAASLVFVREGERHETTLTPRARR
jgi:hypothetical protein